MRSQKKSAFSSLTYAICAPLYYQNSFCSSPHSCIKYCTFNRLGKKNHDFALAPSWPFFFLQQWTFSISTILEYLKTRLRTIVHLARNKSLPKSKRDVQLCHLNKKTLYFLSTFLASYRGPVNAPSSSRHFVHPQSLCFPVVLLLAPSLSCPPVRVGGASTVASRPQLPLTRAFWVEEAAA